MQLREFGFGGSMKLSVAARDIVIGTCIFLLSLTAQGQGLPPGVTQGMVEQLKSMSPEEQQALADQYGISLPSNVLPSPDLASARVPTDSSGLASSVLESFEAMGMAQDEVDAAGADEAEEMEEDAVKRYGQALFTRDVSTFAPTDDAPVPQSYRLGVGDQLTVQLFGKENSQLKMQIDRSGDISFPKLGSITLAGLTFEDARDLIKTRVKQQLIGVDAVVSMGGLRAINVFMAGEVAVPGAFSVSALTTVTQALFQAGGVTDIGSLRNVQVKRAGAVVAIFDTYDLLMKGDLSDDIRLQSGDVVFVPPYEGVIQVEGELKRPMLYELVGGETLKDVLAMAGSFTRDAYPELSVLTRRSNEYGLPQASTIDLSNESLLLSAVHNGDTLVVPKAASLVANSVMMQGAVTRPGNYGWYPGLRLSNLVSDVRRDLVPGADLGLGMIIRQKNTLLDIEVIAFDLAAVIGGPGTDHDPLLKEFDEVLVFSLPTSDPDGDDVGVDADTSRQVLLAPVIERLSSQVQDDEPVQIVSVSGAVRVPGTYPLFAGATVELLIKAAGGANMSAFLDAAELRRLTERVNGEVVADFRDINVARDGGGNKIELKSRDHLTVRDTPDWAPVDAIVVEGEVKFPGEYRIGKGETLSSVVARAGGFTDKANPDAAVFTRNSVAALEKERAAQFAREIQSSFATRLLTEETSTRGISEISQIVLSLQAVEGAGRLLINLPAAISGDLEADLEVENGDSLLVPGFNNTVSVVGEVKRQATHSFQGELTLEDYIDLSAGLTQRADDGGIYIVKANGSVVTLRRSLWRFTGDKRSLDPGDTIVVPINTQYKESLASWREITQILYQSMVTIAAVMRL